MAIDFRRGLYGGGDLVKVPEKIDPTAIVSEIDVSKALAVFNQHEPRIRAMSKACADIEVTDDTALVECTKMANILQDGIENMQRLEKNICKPLTDAAGKIRATVKVHLSEMETSKKILGTKADMYWNLKELKEKIEADKRRKEAIEAQAQLDKEAAMVGMDAPRIEIPSVTAAKSSVIQTSKGSAYRKKNTVVEVTDESLIPREYLKPDMVKIRKASNGGVDIPGVKRKEVKTTQFRRPA